VTVRPVADDQGPIVAWPYQDSRHDLAPTARGDGWVDAQEPVPGKPDIAPDHWIRTT
jgi:hypothetical protein